MGFFPFRDRNRKRNDVNSRNQAPDLTGADYIFQTGIVTEYIAEPDDYLSREVSEAGNLFSSLGASLQTLTVGDILLKRSKDYDVNPRNYISNPEDAEIMPKNSIMAYIIDEARAKNGQKPFVCYPFFPSHLSLPVKPGEHVWIVKEETFGRDVYYWMCRKPGIKQSEDTNYTHVERINPVTAQLEANRESGLLGGSLFNDDLDDRMLASFENINPSNLPEGVTNDSIVFDSIAYKEEFTGEPVPPVRKKCGDTLLQGSNNAMLHMTTEKFFYTTRDPDTFAGGLSANQNLTGRAPLSPAIDLCVGRKDSELNSLASSALLKPDKDQNGNIKIIKNLRGKNYSSLENYEIDKTVSVKGETEDLLGSIDESAINCGGRLYLSNNCAVDAAFGSAFDVLTGYGGSSAALYSTNSRIVADGTLRLANRLGESFLDFDPVGNIVMKSSINNGQQFISLMKSGTTRIQAKNGGKIQFAVRNNNGAPDEPYILYSELRDLLEAICADIASLNILSEAIGKISAVMEELFGPWKGAVEAANTALETAGATKLFAEDAKVTAISFPQLMFPAFLPGPDIPPYLGKNETLEDGTSARGTIASTKIFGETNDDLQTMTPEPDLSTGTPEDGFGSPDTMNS